MEELQRHKWDAQLRESSEEQGTGPVLGNWHASQDEAHKHITYVYHISHNEAQVVDTIKHLKDQQ